MKRTLVSFLAALLLTTLPAAAQNFVFELRGSQEAPPTNSTASGGCMGTLNQGAGTFSVTCVHNVVNATVMHIHRGAAGVNGAVAFDLGAPISPVTATWTGMTATDISDMLAGNLYVNIHSSGRPTGDIRGQIVTRSIDNVAFTATEQQFVPSPGSGPATASCTADLDNSATQLAISCTHDVPTPSSANVSEGPFGTAGPLVFTFPNPNSPFSANVPMTPRLVADFEATFLYLEVHGVTGSEDTAGPQIRGQIGTPPAAATTGTISITKQTSPAGGTGFSFSDDIPGGPAAFSLNDGATQTFSSVAAGTYTITENALSGWSLTDLTCSNAESTVNPFTRTATVVLHAAESVQCTFTNLQSPGPASSLFAFTLRGDQEVPPTGETASGGCFAQFDSGTSTLAMVCTHNVVDATVMHIHHGAAGVNGTVAFDLGSPVSPIEATWSGMSPSDVADLFAGNLYVNIHSAGRPTGAIRGQIVARSIDSVSFTPNEQQFVPPGSGTASGSCTADLDNAAAQLAISCTHNVPTPTSANVSDAPIGHNGPIVFTFPSPASPFAANVPMTPRLVADYEATFLYLEVHGATGSENAGPQIRGQIGTPPAAATTGTINIIKRTSPAGGTGFTFTDDVPGGPASFSLNDGATRTFTNVAAGTYTITENALSGWSLTDLTCSNAESTVNPFNRTATVVLHAAETVTCTFTNLRSVTAPSSIFAFRLGSDQEVPPTPETARGGCFAQFDGGTSTLSLVCTHNVVDATVMHIHHGAAGTNGTVAFDLGSPVSPIEATWSGMSPSDVTDLLAGNLYVNIHTGGRPAGAIRGQIVPRSVDMTSFVMNGAQEVPPNSSTGSGYCSSDLSDDAASVLVRCTHNLPAVTDTHVHDAPPGVDGPVVFDLPDLNSFSANVPLTPRLIADYEAGFLYVNVHTAESPGGEIRGQMFGNAAATVEDIPTLNEWMVVMLAALLIGMGCLKLR